MATSAELAAHQTATTAHASALNLANRETTGPESGLVKANQLTSGTEVTDPGDDPLKAAVRADRQLGPANAVHHAAKHAIGGLDPVSTASVTSGIEQGKTCTPAGGQITIVTAELSAAQAKPGTVINFTLIGSATTAAGIGQSVDFTIFHQNGGASTPILIGSIPLTANKSWTFHLLASVGIGVGRAVAGSLYAEMSDTGAVGTEVHADAGAAIGFIAPAAASRFFAAVAWVGGSLGSTLSVSNALASGVALP
jgi:hypothetical protein